VDLQEKRQLDLVKQAASVRTRARPWRAIIFTVLAIASYAFGRQLKTLLEPGHLGSSIAAAAAAVAFLVFATIAVVSVASARSRASRAWLSESPGPGDLHVPYFWAIR
jgi:hypothetical protein